jgi:hypothetical protein
MLATDYHFWRSTIREQPRSLRSLNWPNEEKRGSIGHTGDGGEGSDGKNKDLQTVK